VVAEHEALQLAGRLRDADLAHPEDRVLADLRDRPRAGEIAEITHRRRGAVDCDCSERVAAPLRVILHLRFQPCDPLVAVDRAEIPDLAPRLDRTLRAQRTNALDLAGLDGPIDLHLPIQPRVVVIRTEASLLAVQIAAAGDRRVVYPAIAAPGRRVVCRVDAPGV